MAVAALVPSALLAMLCRMTSRRQRKPVSLATARLAAHGFTQQDLAERAQVTVPAVSRWLRGDRNGPAGQKLRLVVETELPAAAASEVLAAIPAQERSAA